MSDREVFEKLQKYIPPWIVFDDEKSEYKLSEKALNSEENHEIKNSYNREWWIFNSAVEHCKQGEPTFYAHKSTEQILKEIQGHRRSEVTLKLTLQPQPEHGLTFPLFTHAMPKSEPLAWIYEDELPSNYPYNEMFEHSKVDGVRMFPVYAPSTPQPSTDVSELVQALKKARAGLSNGLWDYGTGQDEHEQCDVLINELDALIAKHAVK